MLTIPNLLIMSNHYNLNDNQTRLHFISINFEILAAIGWRGYQEQGRGCVFIDNSPQQNINSQLFSNQNQWNPETLLGFYIGENGDDFKTILGKTWPDQETADRVAQYNPNLKTNLLIWFGNQAPNFLIQGFSVPNFTPNLCYQRLANRLSEFTVELSKK